MKTVILNPEVCHLHLDEGAVNALVRVLGAYINMEENCSLDYESDDDYLLAKTIKEDLERRALQ